MVQSAQGRLCDAEQQLHHDPGVSSMTVCYWWSARHVTPNFSFLAALKCNAGRCLGAHQLICFQCVQFLLALFLFPVSACSFQSINKLNFFFVQRPILPCHVAQALRTSRSCEQLRAIVSCGVTSNSRTTLLQWSLRCVDIRLGTAWCRHLLMAEQVVHQDKGRLRHTLLHLLPLILKCLIFCLLGFQQNMC